MGYSPIVGKRSCGNTPFESFLILVRSHYCTPPYPKIHLPRIHSALVVDIMLYRFLTIAYTTARDYFTLSIASVRALLSFEIFPTFFTLPFTVTGVSAEV